jgi:hypothetical protein
VSSFDVAKVESGNDNITDRNKLKRIEVCAMLFLLKNTHLELSIHTIVPEQYFRLIEKKLI